MSFVDPERKIHCRLLFDNEAAEICPSFFSSLIVDGKHIFVRASCFPTKCKQKVDYVENWRVDHRRICIETINRNWIVFSMEKLVAGSATGWFASVWTRLANEKLLMIRIIRRYFKKFGSNYRGESAFPFSLEDDRVW